MISTASSRESAALSVRCHACDHLWIPTVGAGLSRRCLSGILDAAVVLSFGMGALLAADWIGVRPAVLRDGTIDAWLGLLASPVIQIGLELFPIVLVSVVYFTLMLALRGQTLGMRAARIAVVGPRAHIPSVVRAVVRAVLQAVGLLLGGVTLAWVIIDRERRTLHDRLANTFPIRAGGTP